MKRHGPKFAREFKKIRWKPMDRKRRAAQDSEAIILWFKEYDRLQKEYRIRAQDI